MTICDQAITILEQTDDGDRLEPRDLKLLENGVNGFLNEAGEAAFAALYASVVDGSYFETVRWFHGIEHLTRDHQGYVFWKGTNVEHYSFSDREREKAAAEELAGRCLQLEAVGFPVTGRTVLSADCYEATAGTPWKLALQTYYGFFEDGKDVVGIFYRTGESAKATPVFSIRVDGQKVSVTEHPGAYEAFHSLQDAGLTSLQNTTGFEDCVSRLERLGVSPERLDAEIQGLSL